MFFLFVQHLLKSVVNEVENLAVLLKTLLRKRKQLLPKLNHLQHLLLVFSIHKVPLYPTNDLLELLRQRLQGILLESQSEIPQNLQLFGILFVHNALQQIVQHIPKILPDQLLFHVVNCADFRLKNLVQVQFSLEIPLHQL